MDAEWGTLLVEGYKNYEMFQYAINFVTKDIYSPV